MKEKCYKCGEEFSAFGFYFPGKELCYGCKRKEEFREWMVLAALCLVVLLTLLGLRIVWVKFIYKDARCAFAECRIEVDPKP